MIFNISPPQTGKTNGLIRKSHLAALKGKAVYLVCPTKMEARRVYQRARDTGMDIFLPLSYPEFVEKRYTAKHIDGFLIDNVDHLLQWLSPSADILEATATLTPGEPNNEGEPLRAEFYQKEVTANFAKMARRCRHKNGVDCGHPDMEFKSMSCCISNCPLLEE